MLSVCLDWDSTNLESARPSGCADLFTDQAMTKDHQQQFDRPTTPAESAKHAVDSRLRFPVTHLRLFVAFDGFLSRLSWHCYLDSLQLFEPKKMRKGRLLPLGSHGRSLSSVCPFDHILCTLPVFALL